MATRSTISILHENGKVSSIYCHFDGYIKDGVGDMLKNHYTDVEKIEKLISLGDISILEKHVEPVKSRDHIRSFGGKMSEETYPHTFETPHTDVTVAYHRDRNEKLRISKHDNLKYFKISNDFQGINYLFINGAWHVTGYDPNSFRVY